MKIQVGNKTLNINKWKGRHKKEFLKALTADDDLFNNSELMNILVYSCIDEQNVILTDDEFRYVLSRIRAYSLGEDIDIEFYCPKCGNLYEKTFQIKDIIKYTYTPMKEIKVGDVEIKLCEIRNKEIFEKMTAENPDYEMLFKIQSFNGNDTFNLEQLEAMIDDLDVDVLDKIISIYEKNKFKIDDINVVTCTCGHETIYEFDELPGFFPASWFGEE